MKRIAKVENFNGVELKKENGEIVVFNENNIISTDIREINEKTFTVFITKEGYELCYRNTENCTFYQINDIELPDYVDVLEDIKEENTVIVDFYNRNMVSSFFIENNDYEFFGFIDEHDTAYIPFKEEGTKERCFVCMLSEIEEFITERKDIDGKLLLLSNRSGASETELNVGSRTLTFTTVQDEHFRTFMFNKNSCDMVVKVEDEYNSENIGFVENGILYYIIERSIGFFTYRTFKAIPYEGDMQVVYKKYVSNKRTKGITDLDFREDIFGFFK